MDWRNTDLQLFLTPICSFFCSKIAEYLVRQTETWQKGGGENALNFDFFSIFVVCIEMWNFQFSYIHVRLLLLVFSWKFSLLFLSLSRKMRRILQTCDPEILFSINIFLTSTPFHFLRETRARHESACDILGLRNYFPPISDSACFRFPGIGARRINLFRI